MNRDQGDLPGRLVHKAPAEHRASQERLENQGPWVSVDIEDLMDLQANLEQMESLVQQE